MQYNTMYIVCRYSEFHSLSSARVKPARVKGLRVLPVFRVVMIGEVVDRNKSTLGNGISRELEVICDRFSTSDNDGRVETQDF